MDKRYKGRLCRMMQKMDSYSADLRELSEISTALKASESEVAQIGIAVASVQATKDNISHILKYIE